MVDVLKRGPELGEKVYIANCSDCSSKLRWKESEAMLTDEINVGKFSAVNCPICGTRVYCGVDHYVK